MKSTKSFYLAAAAFLCQLMGCLSQDCGAGNWTYSPSVNHCYKLISSTYGFKWAIGEDKCMKIGGHLASPWNSRQNHIVEEVIKQSGGENQEVWIGLSHPMGHSHHNYTEQRMTGWEWVDGSNYSYTGRNSRAWTGWAQDEPGAYETWVRMYNGEWKGIGGSKKYNHAICQKDPSLSTASSPSSTKSIISKKPVAPKITTPTVQSTEITTVSSITTPSSSSASSSTAPSTITTTIKSSAKTQTTITTRKTTSVIVTSKPPPTTTFMTPTTTKIAAASKAVVLTPLMTLLTRSSTLITTPHEITSTSTSTSPTPTTKIILTTSSVTTTTSTSTTSPTTATTKMTSTTTSTTAVVPTTIKTSTATPTTTKSTILPSTTTIKTAMTTSKTSSSTASTTLSTGKTSPSTLSTALTPPSTLSTASPKPTKLISKIPHQQQVPHHPQEASKNNSIHSVSHVKSSTSTRWLIPVAVLLCLIGILLALLILGIYFMKIRKRKEDKKQLLKNEGGGSYDIELRKFNDAEFDDDVFRNPKSAKDKLAVAFRNFINRKNTPFLYQNEIEEKPTAQVKPMKGNSKSSKVMLSDLELFMNRSDYKQTIRRQFQALPPTVDNTYDGNPLGEADVDSFYRKNTFIVVSETPKIAWKDIWAMVWNRSVEHIILFGTSDKAQALVSDEVKVYVEEEKTTDFHITRILRLQKSNESRTVMLYYFRIKYDPGSTSYRFSLLRFRELLRKVSGDGAPPVMVFDSQGNGMAGTFLAIDSLLDEGAQSGSVDVVRCVSKLREQTPTSERVDHVELIYQVILDDLNANATSVRLEMDEDCSSA